MGALVASLSAAGGVAQELAFPPSLPGGVTVVRDTSPRFLERPSGLRDDVEVARTPPTVDFLYYPGQTYPGRPWSVWGDGLAIEGKHYSAIGDHLAPAGNAFVFEYDVESRRLRRLVDVRDVLRLPDGHYTPGKIHGRVDLGSDGRLYFSTHRGSTRVTTDQYHYRGDWILRHDPRTGETEIVAHAPVPKHCIPASVLDPERMIFYGGTAAGDHRDKRVMFLAWSVRDGKLLHSGYNGPKRYMILARSTGRVYFVGSEDGRLMRFDPATGGPPVAIPGEIGLRSATTETDGGRVYTVSSDGELFAFDTRTEKVEKLGSAVVGSRGYITSIDVDPTGRFLYYVPGAHGGSQQDGSPLVQFDVRTRRKKVIAFLHPFYRDTYGYTPLGTFGSAVGPRGERVFITWNGNRGGPDRRGRLPFDTCALTVVHIPESERSVSSASATLPPPSTGRAPLAFRDVWGEVEPTRHQRGMMGHAAAWGDVDGDGWVDLFVGTFADRPVDHYRAGGAAGPVPNHLFMNRSGRFVVARSPALEWHGRASGVVVADLDNDGDADLYVSNNGRLGKENRLYRNRGDGSFEDVTGEAGAPVHSPEHGRGATVLDFDGDRLLDLIVLSTVRKGRTRVFRNLGGMRFEESDAIPGDATGLGVAAGDLTGNGWPDVFVGGPDRLFLNRGDGTFREATEIASAGEFRAEDDARSCGVALGDFDRDGRMDILIGFHTKAPWRRPVPVRLLRNAGTTVERARFEDVTREVGIQPFPMRAPHVEMRDFDNDGWPDLYASVVTFRDGVARPAIHRNLGAAAGDLPRFEETAFVHRRDFPAPEDAPGERSGPFYERLVANGKVMYYAPGPSADFDNDGRLDLYMTSWWPRLPSLLLRNETRAGNSIRVRIDATGRINRNGIGCMVRAYRPGRAGDPAALLATEAITTSTGYCSAQPPIAHLGIGEHDRADIIVTLPHGRGKVKREGIGANRSITIDVP